MFTVELSFNRLMAVEALLVSDTLPMSIVDVKLLLMIWMPVPPVSLMALATVEPLGAPPTASWMPPLVVFSM